MRARPARGFTLAEVVLALGLAALGLLAVATMVAPTVRLGGELDHAAEAPDWAERLRAHLRAEGFASVYAELATTGEAVRLGLVTVSDPAAPLAPSGALLFTPDDADLAEVLPRREGPLWHLRATYAPQLDPDRYPADLPALPEVFPFAAVPLRLEVRVTASPQATPSGELLLARHALLPR